MELGQGVLVLGQGVVKGEAISWVAKDCITKILYHMILHCIVSYCSWSGATLPSKVPRRRFAQKQSFGFLRARSFDVASRSSPVTAATVA